MWVVTYSINQEIVNTAEITDWTVDQMIDLFKKIGYEVDDYSSMPEWNRYFLHKYIDGEGMAQITIEEEED